MTGFSQVKRNARSRALAFLTALLLMLSLLPFPAMAEEGEEAVPEEAVP